MRQQERSQQDSVISIFDQELRWWTEVYREDLPRGFFSYEMRRRLDLVATLLAGYIGGMDEPEVLECGCGPGDILERLAHLPCRLTGLDLNPRYLELASAKAPGTTLVDGDVEALPFPDASFDLVYAVGVLPYLQEDRSAVREIARVTRPGGIALISVPNHLTLTCLLDPFYVVRPLLPARALAAGGDGSEVKVRRLRLGKLSGLFREHGMQEIHSEAISFGPWRFWRREMLPLSASIRVSEALRRLSRRKPGSGLKYVSSHWVAVWHKPPSGPPGDR